MIDLKHLGRLTLALTLSAALLSGCADNAVTTQAPPAQETSTPTAPAPRESLPDSPPYTKAEARDLGWSGGGLDDYLEGACIGGDTFGNREGLLPDGKYHECDIDTLGADSRGAKRLVWDEDGNIYYTADHYESFELLYEAP